MVQSNNTSLGLQRGFMAGKPLIAMSITSSLEPTSCLSLRPPCTTHSSSLSSPSPSALSSSFTLSLFLGFLMIHIFVLVLFIFTDFYRGVVCTSGLAMAKPSVRLSDKRVDCDKTKELSANILVCQMKRPYI